jgi:hypothetical protein
MQFVLFKKNSGWMDVWELKPERLQLLWLKASATWRRITFAKDLHNWRRLVLFLFHLYPSIFLKIGEKQGT